jgi:hypothetical protein
VAHDWNIWDVGLINYGEEEIGSIENESWVWNLSN